MTTETLPALTRKFADITIVSSQAMLDKVKDDIDDAASLTIDSEFLAAAALESAGRISTVLDALDKERLDITKPLRDGQSWVNDGYKPALDSLKAAKLSFTNKLTAWDREVRVQRQREEAAAQKVRDEAARVAREASEKAQREAEALAQQAADAQAAGDDSKAADLVDQAQQAADVATAQSAVAVTTAAAPAMRGYSSPARVSGTSTKWKANIVDKTLLLAHIAKRLAEGDKSLLNLIDINESNLNALAAIQKADLNLPGVESYPQDGVRVKKSAV